jgi:LAGLIDADG endonuclease
MDISYKDTNFKPTLNDSWLCGFTDAEGCFTSSISKIKNPSYIVSVRYILSQKSNKENMEYFSNLLNGYLTYLKSYDGYNVVVAKLNLTKTIKYFNEYQLKTKKYINYLIWLKIYNLVDEKKHLTEIGLNKIRKLKEKLNKN